MRSIDRLRAAAHTQLGVDVLEVELDGVFGHEDRVRGLAIRRTAGHQRQNLLLALGQGLQRLIVSALQRRPNRMGFAAAQRDDPLREAAESLLGSGLAGSCLLYTSDAADE